MESYQDVKNLDQNYSIAVFMEITDHDVCAKIHPTQPTTQN